MRANGLDERALRDGRYDGILHLVTAACGAEEHYTLENNETRSESVEEAKDVGAISASPAGGRVAVFRLPFAAIPASACLYPSGRLLETV